MCGRRELSSPLATRKLGKIQDRFPTTKVTFDQRRLKFQLTVSKEGQLCVQQNCTRKNALWRWSPLLAFDRSSLMQQNSVLFLFSSVEKKRATVICLWYLELRWAAQVFFESVVKSWALRGTARFDHWGVSCWEVLFSGNKQVQSCGKFKTPDHSVMSKTDYLTQGMTQETPCATLFSFSPWMTQNNKKLHLTHLEMALFVFSQFSDFISEVLLPKITAVCASACILYLVVCCFSLSMSTRQKITRTKRLRDGGVQSVSVVYGRDRE